MSPLSIAALIDASPSQKQMRPVAFATPFFVGFTLLSMKLVSGLVTSSVSADAIESLRVITQPDAQIARAATAMSFFIFFVRLFFCRPFDAPRQRDTRRATNENITRPIFHNYTIFCDHVYSVSEPTPHGVGRGGKCKSFLRLVRTKSGSYRQ